MAFAMLPLVDAELRLRGWRRCHARWSRWAKNGSSRPVADPVSPDRIAWLVERAARTIPWIATCLRRSLVLWTLLARSGCEPALRLGFRKTAASFEIHAWVELDGIPMNEQADVQTRYAPFDEKLAPREWREA